MPNYKKQNFPTPKKSRKKFTLSQWIVFILMIFWTICGTLSVVLTVKDCTKTASADTITNDIVFSGSNFNVNNVGSYGSGLNDTSLLIPNTGFTNVSFTFTTSANTIRVTSDYYNMPARYSDTAFTYRVDTTNYVTTFIYLTADDTVSGFTDTSIYGLYAYNNPLITSSNVAIFFIRYNQDIFNNNGINFDIVEFGQEVLTVNNNDVACNYVAYSHYNDLNNAKLYIYFPISTSSTLDTTVGFTYRKYYLNPEIFGENSQNAYDSGYDKGYQNGRLDGNSIGYNNGKLDGLEEGYQNGLRDGKQQGYNDGLQDANDYSFLGLISALFDAPVTMISGLLNFNILGFNLLQFMLGLMTLGLVLFVVRLFL